MVVYNNDTDVYLITEGATEYVAQPEYEIAVLSINDGMYTCSYNPRTFITTHIGWPEPSISIY